ncbi:type 1 glutamine amidotransferase domain-containing protein [Pseudenhygromyxa sp. WMMC2535]|uniref:type 1 glutamine amidotransferase domain-containing protein n=1 Tax=Pseudenhygromyxa sp. WMMC2535 TaxID=2712867 RepID=UPI0031F7CD31
MRILFPLPESDFDPTETAVPWHALREAGHEVVFATPDGRPAQADPRILTGRGFALWRPILRAGEHARELYDRMAASEAFQHPLPYARIDDDDQHFDGLLLTGGHASGMKRYLESPEIQTLVVQHMRADKPVGAICHGVLVPARAEDPQTGRSVLHGRKTTGLSKAQEMSAWAMTGLWLGSYYRTYSTTVQEEVSQALASPDDFIPGPISLRREGPERDHGHTVRDGNYLSAGYYVDAYQFARDYVAMLDELDASTPDT